LELNLKYVDFRDEEGETYKSHLQSLTIHINHEYEQFYSRLKRSLRPVFAVCVASVLRERQDILRRANCGDMLYNRLLCYGRSNMKELNLRLFEQVIPEIAQAAVSRWQEALRQQVSPAQRWRWVHPQPCLERCFDRQSGQEEDLDQKGVISARPESSRPAPERSQPREGGVEVELAQLNSPVSEEPVDSELKEEPSRIARLEKIGPLREAKHDKLGVSMEEPMDRSSSQGRDDTSLAGSSHNLWNSLSPPVVRTSLPRPSLSASTPPNPRDLTS
jgi:hypothetical protein